MSEDAACTLTIDATLCARWFACTLVLLTTLGGTIAFVFSSSSPTSYETFATYDLPAECRSIGRPLRAANTTFVFLTRHNTTDLSISTSFEHSHCVTRDAVASSAVRTWLKSFATVHADLAERYCDTYLHAYAPLDVWRRHMVVDVQLYACAYDEAARRGAIGRVGLPSDVLPHVDHILGMAPAPPPPPPPPSVTDELRDLASLNVVTPPSLRAYYRINETGSSLARQSVFETFNQLANGNDLRRFLNAYNISTNEIDLFRFRRGYVPGGAEANLDVQYMLAVAPGVPLQETFISSVHWVESVAYLLGHALEDFIMHVVESGERSHVYSLSYQWYESQIDEGILRTFNDVARRLSHHGVTLVADAGDDGVAGWSARSDAARCAYAPLFPASSPYVVAVGGTQGPENNASEIVCSSSTGAFITSGGGFSDYFPRPAWQQSVVSAYNIPSIVPGYNTSGRAYPDVAMAAHYFVTVLNGRVFPLDGTSASAPVFAGMLSLVNSRRLALGRGSLGNVTRHLYEAPAHLFTDVTDGNNTCTANPSVCCAQGFPATAGWDPATGRGSVRYDALLTMLMGV